MTVKEFMESPGRSVGQFYSKVAGNPNALAF